MFGGTARILLLLAGLGLASPAGALTTFTVDKADDESDSNLADGVCDRGDGKCTLRAAIEQANATADPAGTLITFDLGKKTITPQSFLPSITADFVTVSDAGSKSEITLDGVDAGGVRGLEIEASHCAIQGLSIRSWTAGIFVDGSFGIDGNNLIGTDGDGVDDAAEGNTVFGNSSTGVVVVDSNSNVIAGNVIGLRPNGVVDGNEVGVTLTGSGAGLNSNVVGTNGDGVGDAAEGNVISGNDFIGVFITQDAVTNTVAGNYIGTDATGALARGNGSLGIWIQSGADGNVIGTNGDGVSDAEEGNVISASALAGIEISNSFGTVIAGNRIGTDVSGTSAMGNGGSGIFVVSSNSTRIGTNGDATSDALEGNVIGDNAASGISLLGVGAGASSSIISGNAIGTDPSGSIDLGNAGFGISLQESSGGTQNNLIGGDTPLQANSIAHNMLDGVFLGGGAGPGSGNAILGNSIHTNGGLGIAFGESAPTLNDVLDVDAGPNDLMNHPSPTWASSNGTKTVVDLSISQGLPNRSFRVQVFSSPACDPSGRGEGRTFLGEKTLVTDGAGNAALNGAELPTPTPIGHAIAATATLSGRGSDSTSEFSPCVFADVSLSVALIEAFKALLEVLDLKPGPQNALETKVDRAIESLGRANYGAAVNQLGAFMYQVGAYERRGTLDPRDAARLVEDAESAIAAIQGGR